MSDNINLIVDDSENNIVISADNGNDSISETIGGDPYYTDLAKQWAIKMGSKVQGADYSSKYYATQAKADAKVITDNIAAITVIGTNISDITTVAGNISDVSAVGGSILSVNAVAADLTNIDSVVTNISDISAVADDLTNISAVAADLTNIDSVADDLTNIDAVNTNKTNINSVASNITNVNTVAGISSDITTVSGSSASISAVAGNSTNINTVAGSISNVNTVASSISNVNAVYSNASNINAVAGDLTNINSVAADLTNIDNASTYASSAQSAASLAEDWANKMNGTVDGSEYSAKYYAQQAAQGQVQANWAETNTTSKAYIQNKPTTVYYATSSTAAATVEKEVSIPSITSLETGQIIVVQPTITSTVANSTIKLNNFTAYPMRYNNAAVTTTTDSVVWSSAYVSAFIFDGTYWQFLCHGLDSNTTYTLNYSCDAGAYKVGTGTYAVSRYSLMLQKADMTWEKPTSTSAKYSTATTKTVNTNGFRLGQIKYYSSTSDFANGANIAANVVYDKSASVDLRYSTNCGNAPAWTAGQQIYLVGTMGADGLFYLDTTTWWTNTLPNTNDGKIYVKLGIFVSDAKITLLDKHPVYYHNGNRICEYIYADNMPVVNDATLTLTQGGVTKGTFTANASSNVTIDLDAGGGTPSVIDGGNA